MLFYYKQIRKLFKEIRRNIVRSYKKVRKEFLFAIFVYQFLSIAQKRQIKALIILNIVIIILSIILGNSGR